MSFVIGAMFSRNRRWYD